MNSMLKVAVLSIPLITFSSCPPTIAIVPGLWFFSLSSSPGEVLPLTLNADGSTMTFDDNALPPGATATFGGTLTWGQSRNRFTMEQDNSPFLSSYTGTIVSPTQLNGTGQLTSNMGSSEFTWSAFAVNQNP